MLLWIETQSTETIGLTVFALSYAAAGAVFLLSRLLAQSRIAVDLRATTPVMLTPLAVIAALLIAFLASRVWSDLDNANASLAREASSIHEVNIYADTLPPEIARGLHGFMSRYVEFVARSDWPAMMQDQANLREVPQDLTGALKLLMNFEPASRGDQEAQGAAMRAIETAIEARQARILLSRSSIAPLQWIVVIVLAALILLTIAMVHLDRPVTMAVNLITFSTAIAACLVLLMANDRPFGAGGNVLQPTALREVGLQ